MSLWAFAAIIGFSLLAVIGPVLMQYRFWRVVLWLLVAAALLPAVAAGGWYFGAWLAFAGGALLMTDHGIELRGQW